MLYDLAAFQQLVRNGNWGYLNERRPFATRDKLNWTDDDVAELLCRLSRDDYEKSVANCAVSDVPEQELIDADQYCIFWNEDDRTRHAQWSPTTLTFSLKIALLTDVDGQVAGLVTLHLSGVP